MSNIYYCKYTAFPANNYLLKVTIQTPGEGVKYAQS